MKRGQRVVLVLLACGLATVVTVLIWPREPSYQGKKLSEWITIWGGAKSLDVTWGAEAAVHQIGTNGLPFLVKWVTYQRPRWKEKIAYASFLPGVVRANSLVRLLDGEKAELRADNAVLGFHAIGPQASAAVPELCRIAKGAGSSRASGRAMRVLMVIAPEVLPSSREVLAPRMR